MRLSLKLKILLPVIISFMIIWIINMLFFNYNFQNANLTVKRDSSEDAIQDFASLKNSDTNMLSMALDILMRNDGLRELSIKKDRVALYKAAYRIFSNGCSSLL